MEGLFAIVGLLLLAGVAGLGLAFYAVVKLEELRRTTNEELRTLHSRIAQLRSPVAPETPSVRPTEAAPEPQPAPKPAPSPKPPLHDQAAELRTRRPVAPKSAPPQPPAAPPPPAGPEPKTERRHPPQPQAKPEARPPASAFSWSDLESRLGANWLNKLGVAVLVIGISLLLGYTFERVGPAGKILLGYAVAATLLAAGLWLEKRVTYRLYGRGLIAGGWSLGYFTTYALHFVEATRVVEQEVAAITLLTLFTGAMIAATLRYRSEVVTGLAAAVAFATLAISPGTFLANVAVLLLDVFLVVTVIRGRWLGAGVLGVVGTFGVHLLGVAAAPPPTLLWGLLFPVLYWICYLAPPLLLDRTDGRDRTLLQLLNVANAGGLLLVVGRVPDTDVLLGLLGGLGALYLALALGIRRSSRRSASFATFAILGAILLVAAPALRWSDASLIVIWALEAEALLLTGVLLREPLMTRLGVATFTIVSLATLAAGPGWTVWLLVALLLHANAWQLPARLAPPHADEDGLSLVLLTYPATLFAAIGLYQALHLNDWQRWTALVWLPLAVGLWEWGRSRSAGELRVQGHLLAFSGWVAAPVALTLARMPDWEGHLLCLATIATVYGLSWRTLTAPPAAKLRPIEAGARRLYTWAASALLLFWLMILALPFEWAIPAWAVFALALQGASRRVEGPDLRAQSLAAAWLTFAVLMPAIGFEIRDLVEAPYWLITGATVALLYGVYFAFLKDPETTHFNPMTRLAAALVSAQATLLLVAAFGRWLPGTWLPLGLMGLAGALYAASTRAGGFTLRAQTHVLAPASFLLLAFGNLADAPELTPLWVRWTVALAVIVGLHVLSAGLARQRAARTLRTQETAMPEALSYLGAIAGLLFIHVEVTFLWVAAVWAAIGAAALMLSVGSSDGHLRTRAVLLLGAAGLRTLVANLAIGQPGIDGWPHTWPVLTTAALLAAAVATLTTSQSRGLLKETTSWTSPWFERHGADALACLTALILVLLAWQQTPARLLTLLLSGVGLAMMTGGLAVRLRSVRLAGMGLLVLCVLRAFFYDLSGLDTLARIVSFVGLGLVLLAVSFLYTHFRRRLEA